MREVRAFFCENEYYLLPDGYTENGLPDSGVLSVVRLKTENCVPPDFIEEEWEETEFSFGLKPVFFVDVNLYSEEEYAERFGERFAAVCSDCEALCPNKKDNILPLFGDCYGKIRQKEEKFSFFWKSVYFLSELSRRTSELEEMISAGEKNRAEKVVQDMLGEFFFPLDTFIGTDEDGFFALCFSGNLFSAEGLSAATKAIADSANAEGSVLYEKKWRIYPYFPQGIFRPVLRPDYLKRPPKLYYSVNADTEDIEVFVYEKGADEWSVKKAGRKNDALYRYLCFALGEDIILAGTHTVKICGEIPEGKTPVSAAELSEILKGHVLDLYGEYPFPAPFFLRPASERDATFYPYKEHPVGWVTICPEFPPEIEEQEDFSGADKDFSAFLQFLSGGGAFEALGIGYAYLYLPYEEGLGYEKREIVEDWLLDCLEKKSDPGYRSILKIVGIVKTELGECMDIMVFDESGFFRVIQALAPMLLGMKAKLVVVKNGETIVYDVGYEIKPEGAELYS